jgi:hypothetical protein
MQRATTTLGEIKKCVLWALLIGGVTGVLGTWFEIELAYSGWLGMVVLVALIWPVQLMFALSIPYFGFSNGLWIIPQIGIYFVLILILRWVLRIFRKSQSGAAENRSVPTQLPVPPLDE